MSDNSPEWIKPDWPAPVSVRTAITTRAGGESEGSYKGLNLALHVGDKEDDVLHNRKLLTKALGLSEEPVWLSQNHGNTVVDTCHYSEGEADASYSTRAGKACVVLTADCLPILLCNKAGDWVAAVHAGWQGLANRVIEAVIESYSSQKSDLMAYLGPAIGPESFEVQNDVVEACTADLSSAQKKIFTRKCFVPIEDKEGYFLGDIYELGRRRLQKCGVQEIYGGNFCTYKDEERFYSYRRDKDTGRMGSLIWLL